MDTSKPNNVVNASTLKQLADLVAHSAQVIEAECATRGVAFPSLDDPFTPESEQIRAEPAVSEAASVLAAAALHLVALVRPPPITVATAGTSYYLSSALRVAVEANVVEILRGSGPKGMHINEISSQCGLDSGKLARVLRFLTTHHIFREILPDVFANNRLSTILDTGKEPEELFAKPLEKYDNTSGMAALTMHCADEDAKGAAYLWETVSDPATARSEEPNASPMCRAFGTKEQIWTWFEEPHNELRLRRFGVAMDGVNSTQPKDALLNGFDWASLKDGSIVVDVGGGIGVSCISLAKAFPQLKFVIQDRAPVLANAKEHWDLVLPHAVSSGQVTLQAHDFFTEQPVKNAAVFILKQISHDWADKYTRQILDRLREVSSATTRLIVVDHMTPYSCADPDDADQVLPPAPLLANLGAVNPMPYVTDLSMLVHFNSQERTQRHMSALLKSTGWSVTDVHRELVGAGREHLPKYVAKPV